MLNSFFYCLSVWCVFHESCYFCLLVHLKIFTYGLILLSIIKHVFLEEMQLFEDNTFKFANMASPLIGLATPSPSPPHVFFIFPFSQGGDIYRFFCDLILQTLIKFLCIFLISCFVEMLFCEHLVFEVLACGTMVW